jgi:hypothetical protein
MNVPLITMPREEARVQLRQYRTALHRRADAEYQAVVAGLEALADGTPIIGLADAIAAGGFDASGRPNLAVARADRGQVRMWWDGNQAHFDTSRGTAGAGPSMRRTVQVERPDAAPRSSGAWWRPHGYALVPMIPAAVRNSVRYTTAQCFILFEVEQWSDTPLGARPDRDPYLLRHLHGDAYAVLAEWDLTDLERLVMAGRRDN